MQLKQPTDQYTVRYFTKYQNQAKSVIAATQKFNYVDLLQISRLISQKDAMTAISSFSCSKTRTCSLATLTELIRTAVRLTRVRLRPLSSRLELVLKQKSIDNISY